MIVLNQPRHSSPEEVGAGILQDLGRQRETLIQSRKKLDNVDQNIDDSSTILKSMGRRIATNKLITAAIIIVLLGIIGLIIYLSIA